MKIVKSFFKYFFIFLIIALTIRAWYFRPRVDIKALVPEEPFEMALHVTNFPDDPDRFLATEKKGIVKWFHRNSKAADGVVLDHKEHVYSEDQEAGMLSAVLDPQYKTGRPYLYVYYALHNPLRDRIARFTVNENMQADPKSELVIKEWTKFGEGHHAGQMIFGSDSMLWITVGEASAAYYNGAHQLRGKSILGSLIRIDVSKSTKEKPYQVPKDNPFVDPSSGKAPEIWAYGFRNPWRFTINKSDGMITVGDVGDSDREEINIIQKGHDYGWPVMEGELCFPPQKTDCDKTGITLPTVGFTHNVSRSITAGFTYQGDLFPWLKGRYVFGDYLRGLFVIDLDDKPRLISSLYSPDIDLIYLKMLNLIGPQRGETNSIVTIYEGLDKEIYLADLNGVIYQVIPAGFYKQFKGFLFQFLSFR